MKVTVLKEFRDKYNGKRYKPNATLSITKERFEEIRSKDNTLVAAAEELETTEKIEATEEKPAEKPAEKKKSAKKSKE